MLAPLKDQHHNWIRVRTDPRKPEEPNLSKKIQTQATKANSKGVSCTSTEVFSQLRIASWNEWFTKTRCWHTMAPYEQRWSLSGWKDKVSICRRIVISKCCLAFNHGFKLHNNGSAEVGLVLLYIQWNGWPDQWFLSSSLFPFCQRNLQPTTRVS